MIPLALDLAVALHLTWPSYLTEQDAQEHAMAAERAADENGKVSPELLLAVASVETGFRPRVVSLVRGKRFCGVVQAQAGRSKRRCVELQSLEAGYRQGARELAEWIRYARGDLPRALRGYACGVRATKRCGTHGGRKSAYDRRVLAGLRRLQARRRGAP